MKVVGLFIYPVKSMHGVACEQVQLEHRGIAGDRQWMVVDHTGRFLTQRTHPQLATFRPRLTETGLIIEHEGEALTVVSDAIDSAPRVDWCISHQVQVGRPIRATRKMHPSPFKTATRCC